VADVSPEMIDIARDRLAEICRKVNLPPCCGKRHRSLNAECASVAAGARRIETDAASICYAAEPGGVDTTANARYGGSKP
jgi:hypothetical protein